MRSHKDYLFQAALLSEDKAIQAEADYAVAFARGDTNAANFFRLLAEQHRSMSNSQLLAASNYEKLDERLAAGLNC